MHKYTNIKNIKRKLPSNYFEFFGIIWYLDVILKKKMIDDADENMIGIYFYPVQYTIQ